MLKYTHTHQQIVENDSTPTLALFPFFIHSKSLGCTISHAHAAHVSLEKERVTADIFPLEKGNSEVRYKIA